MRVFSPRIVEGTAGKLPEPWEKRTPAGQAGGGGGPKPDGWGAGRAG